MIDTVIKEIINFDYSKINNELEDDNTISIELENAHISFKLNLERKVTFQETRFNREEKEIVYINADNIDVSTNDFTGDEAVLILEVSDELNKQLKRNYLNTNN